MYQAYDIYWMIIRYTDGTSLVALFLFALIYFYLKSEEIYKKRVTILLLLGFLLVFNNIVLSVVGRVIGYAMYYRFFWGIPMVLIITLAIVRIVDQEKLATRKAILILLFGLMISVGGSNLNTLISSINTPENRYNIPHDVIEVAYIINNHSQVERPIIAANAHMNIHIRQYEPSFLWGVRRTAFIQGGRLGEENPSLITPEDMIVRVVELGHQNPYEVERFRYALNDRRIDYVVSWTWFELDQYMEQVGFYVIDRAQHHTVYGRGESLERD